MSYTCIIQTYKMNVEKKNQPESLQSPVGFLHGTAWHLCGDELWRCTEQKVEKQLAYPPADTPLVKVVPTGWPHCHMYLWSTIIYANPFYLEIMKDTTCWIKKKDWTFWVNLHLNKNNQFH